MNEDYREQLAAIRELTTVFLSQISDLSVSLEIEARVDPKIAELERELATDTPDLVTIRDLIALVRDILEEVPRQWVH